MNQVLLFVFCVLFAFNLYGKDYKRYTESVSSEKVGTDTVVNVTLTDKSTWKIIVPALEEHLLYDLEKDLKPGIEAKISLCPKSPWLRINGIKTGMSKETKSILPTIKKIEKIEASEGGWFFGPSYKYKVHLSDESIWDIAWDYMLSAWSFGDKILVQETSFKERVVYDLINIDAPHLTRDNFDYRVAPFCSLAQ